MFVASIEGLGPTRHKQAIRSLFGDMEAMPRIQSLRSFVYSEYPECDWLSSGFGILQHAL